jgi:hypothetical protein
MRTNVQGGDFLYTTAELYRLLSKPFQRRLPLFRVSVTKRKITRSWPQDKERILRQLYKDDVYQDEVFLRYLADYYYKMEPLLIQSFHEEYPEERPTPKKLLEWMEECAIASDLLDRKKERNVWVDWVHVMEWLMEANLLHEKAKKKGVGA